MRMIGSFNEEPLASRLGDYLIVNGMPNHVEPGSAGDWQVWVERDDDLARACAELNAFRNAPGDSKYDASAEAKRVRKERDARDKKLRKKFVDVRTSWARPGRTVVTIVLVALCVIGAAFTQLGDNERYMSLFNFVSYGIEQDGDGQWIIPGPGLWQDLLHGQVWRLITPVFVHIGVLHLIFNMSWLVSLGSLMESRKSSLYLALFFFVSAIGSNFVQYFWSISRHELPMAFGMSGVVYALFGFVWLRGRFAPQEGMGVSQQTIVIMLVWLVICMTGRIGPIANGAHVGGLLIGCAIGAWPMIERKRGRR